MYCHVAITRKQLQEKTQHLFDLNPHGERIEALQHLVSRGDDLILITGKQLDFPAHSSYPSLIFAAEYSWSTAFPWLGASATLNPAMLQAVRSKRRSATS
jgi:hypothetical protein